MGAVGRYAGVQLDDHRWRTVGGEVVCRDGGDGVGGGREVEDGTGGDGEIGERGLGDAGGIGAGTGGGAGGVGVPGSEGSAPDDDRVGGGVDDREADKSTVGGEVARLEVGHGFAEGDGDRAVGAGAGRHHLRFGSVELAAPAAAVSVAERLVPRRVGKVRTVIVVGVGHGLEVGAGDFVGVTGDLQHDHVVVDRVRPGWRWGHEGGEQCLSWLAADGEVVGVDGGVNHGLGELDGGGVDLAIGIDIEGGHVDHDGSGTVGGRGDTGLVDGFRVEGKQGGTADGELGSGAGIGGEALGVEYQIQDHVVDGIRVARRSVRVDEDAADPAGQLPVVAVGGDVDQRGGTGIAGESVVADRAIEGEPHSVDAAVAVDVEGTDLGNENATQTADLYGGCTLPHGVGDAVADAVVSAAGGNGDGRVLGPVPAGGRCRKRDDHVAGVDAEGSGGAVKGGRRGAPGAGTVRIGSEILQL